MDKAGYKNFKFNGSSIQEIACTPDEPENILVVWQNLPGKYWEKFRDDLEYGYGMEKDLKLWDRLTSRRHRLKILKWLNEGRHSENFEPYANPIRNDEAP